MRTAWGLLAAAVVVAGWFLYHYLEFRRCGERYCVAPTDRPPIRLASGREVSVLSTHLSDDRHLTIDYLTHHRRNDLPALCAEAREVWESVSPGLDTRRTNRILLGPTSPESEFLGMRYLVVPLYTCCVSTYLAVEKDDSGKWVFPQCSPTSR